MTRLIYIAVGFISGIIVVRNTESMPHTYQGTVWTMILLCIGIGWAVGRRGKNSAVATAVATAVSTATVDFEAKLKAQAQAMAQVNIIQNQMRETLPQSQPMITHTPSSRIDMGTVYTEEEWLELLERGDI